jgi:predicted nucleic acid-binding protein
MLKRLPISIDPETVEHAWVGAINIASMHELTVYDAVYLELGLRTGLPLATLDRALANAANVMGVPVLGY